MADMTDMTLTPIPSHTNATSIINEITINYASLGDFVLIWMCKNRTAHKKRVQLLMKRFLKDLPCALPVLVDPSIWSWALWVLSGRRFFKDLPCVLLGSVGPNPM